MLCLTSGVSFGLAAVVAKKAFAAGFTVPSLLTGRFAIAAVVFWVIVAIRRPAWPSVRSLQIAIGLGALGYAFQSAFYFGALTRLNASMVAQLLYIYPALVMAIAVLRRRESVTRRGLTALACSGIGLALLLQSGGGSGPMPTAGVLMALGAGGTYALYITVAGGLPEDLDVYLLAAIVCTSAAVSVGGYAALSGSLRSPASTSGWGWLLLFAMVPTVVAIVTFLAGLRLVGGSVAAILSCLEPVTTAASAAVVFGERLSALQIAGAAIVLSAVLVLQAPGRRVPAPATPATPVAPAAPVESAAPAEPVV
jgi:drug/metabolite transporter (DMT)-like permease